jgi:hypothetical protein
MYVPPLDAPGDVVESDVDGDQTCIPVGPQEVHRLCQLRPLGVVTAVTPG